MTRIAERSVLAEDGGPQDPESEAHLPTVPTPESATAASGAAAPTPVLPQPQGSARPAGPAGFGRIARRLVDAIARPRPTAPHTREEHEALARNAAARELREREAHRALALRVPQR